MSYFRKILIVLFYFIGTLTVNAEIPAYVNFQGFLTDSSENAVSDGSYTINFSLWDGDSEITSNKLWEETQVVDVERGIYSVSLGSSNSFPVTMTFSKPYYLGIKIDNEYLKKSNGKLIDLSSVWTCFRSKTSSGRNIKSINQNYSISQEDDIILASGSITLTLPTAVNSDGRIISIKNTNTQDIIVETTASQTIDNNSSLRIVEQYDTLTIVSDGQNWVKLNQINNSLLNGIFTSALSISDSTSSDAIVINSTGGSIIIGKDSTADSSGVALGKEANGEGGVAIGYKADGNSNGTAIGEESNAYQGVAVGKYSNGSTSGSALGYSANASNSGSALGESANGSQYGLALGNSANANSVTASSSTAPKIAIGYQTSNDQAGNTCVIRGSLYLDGAGSKPIYFRDSFGSGDYQEFTMTSGAESSSNTDFTSAISISDSSNSNAIVINSSGDSIMIGKDSTADNSGVALGKEANGEVGVAIGYKADGNSNGTAIGEESNAYQGVAVGKYSNGSTSGSALGYSANASNSGSALGESANGSQYGLALGNSANANSVTASSSTAPKIAIGYQTSNDQAGNTCVIRGSLFLDGAGSKPIYFRDSFGSGNYQEFTMTSGAESSSNTDFTSAISISDSSNSNAIVINSTGDSIMIGKDSTANSSGVALGKEANGNSGVAIGYKADGNYGVALGKEANGNSGVAIGYKAYGYFNGTAIGHQSNGYQGVAVGRYSNGNSSAAALGYSANASSSGSALGNSANGASYGIAIGYEANANVGTNSWYTAPKTAIGYQTSNDQAGNTCMIRGSLYLNYSDGKIHYRADDSSAFSSKDFVIDHPLDPVNKILRHATVESPKVLNTYVGIAELDEYGEARVELPDYFEALNKNPTYHLTPIGKFMPIYVKEEVIDNTFVIAGGEPFGRVSWEVKGERNDRAMRENPLVVEEDKIIPGLIYNYK